MKAENGKKIAKRSYYLPPKLMDIFKKWCLPGRNYSPKVAGAIFLYMQFGGNARELCEKLAFSESIEKSLSEFGTLLNDEIGQIESKLLANDVVSRSEVDAVKQKRKMVRKSSKSA